jgi:hypothetical protein
MMKSYSSRMKILQVKKFPLYDVFFGQGWKNWSRIKVVSEGEITVISGAPLTPRTLGPVFKSIMDLRKGA